VERGLEDCARCDEHLCAKLDRVHAAMVNVGKAVDGVARARINLDRLRRERGSPDGNCRRVRAGGPPHQY
jgi:hypothetical protein